jgi:hypothetical protein
LTTTIAYGVRRDFLHNPLVRTVTPITDSQRGANDIIEQASDRALYRLYRIDQGKRNRLPAAMVPGAIFHPVVISPGGLMETETQKLLSSIGAKLGPGGDELL